MRKLLLATAAVLCIAGCTGQQAQEAAKPRPQNDSATSEAPSVSVPKVTLRNKIKACSLLDINAANTLIGRSIRWDESVSTTRELVVQECVPGSEKGVPPLVVSTLVDDPDHTAVFDYYCQAVGVGKGFEGSEWPAEILQAFWIKSSGDKASGAVLLTANAVTISFRFSQAYPKESLLPLLQTAAASEPKLYADAYSG